MPKTTYSASRLRPAQAAAASKLQARVVRESRLANGLRVLLLPRRGDPAVAVMLFYGVGSRNEREHEAGISHFLEHMMFKGSRRFGKGEIDRLTTELGGSNNAFTSNDHTGYWFEFAADRWERALEVEADRMRRLLLDEREFDAERAVVLDELAMGEDDPWRVLARRVEAALYQRHPYGRPIIGFPDTLRALQVADMRDYYERFYHPANATLVVCGEISNASALAAVRRSFGKLPRSPRASAVDSQRPAPEPLAGEVRLTMEWNDPGSRLCCAWLGAEVGTREDDTLDVLSVLLSGGRMSRLQQRLVHGDRLATSVSFSNEARIERGLVWCFAELAQGADPAALERALEAELARLASEPVAAAELQRAKSILRASEAYERESVSDLAEDVGEWAVDTGDWRKAFNGTRRLARVSAAAVQALAARSLRRDQRVIAWSRPRSGALRTSPAAPGSAADEEQD